MNDCLFCKIAAGELNSYKVAENDNAIAFLDIHPMANGHTIVIPKKHCENLMTCPKEILSSVFELAKNVTERINKSKLKPWGFNFLSNQGSIAGQVIMHFHVHIIPKYAKNEGFEIKMGREYLDDIETVYKKIMKK